MKYSANPVFRVGVEPKNPTDLPKLVKALKYLTKVDTLAKTYMDESGVHMVACAGELHADVCFKTLWEYAQIDIKTSDPVLSYRETVTEESDIACLSKSPNKQNRIWMKALPLQEKLSIAIESEEITSKHDPKKRARLLADNFGWDIMDAKKIWAFGPEHTGANLLVDVTKGVSFLNEIKDSVESAFQWTTKEGVLCSENMRGCRFNILDVMLSHDNITGHGPIQIIPTARRVIYASQLTAKPRLMEPIYLVEICCSKEALAGVYSTLNDRRGQIFSEETRQGTPIVFVKANLPVREAFGFTADLRCQTSGQAFPQFVFDHWQVVDSDPLEENSLANQIILEIRKRKGLESGIPSLDKYLDKL